MYVQHKKDAKREAEKAKESIYKDTPLTLEISKDPKSLPPPTANGFSNGGIDNAAFENESHRL